MKKILLASLLCTLVATTSAWASHPRYDQMANVKTVSHRLENAAHHVHRSAEKYSHHYSRAESAALESLHELNRQARHFHSQVERYFRNPYHTEADFRQLLRSFYQARDAMRYLHGYGHVERDFYKVETRMRDLVDYYGGYGAYRHGGYDNYGHGHGHGYGDRGRYSAYSGYGDHGRSGLRFQIRWRP